MLADFGVIWCWIRTVARTPVYPSLKNVLPVLAEFGVFWCSINVWSVAEYLAMTPSERLQKRKTMITTDPMTGKEMCTICGAQFGASKNLHDHIDSKHLQVYCYSCKFCNKKFTSRGTKYQHESQMHRHHGKVKKVKTPKTETSPLAEIKKEVPEEIEPLLELPPMLPLPPELPPPDSSSWCIFPIFVD